MDTQYKQLFLEPNEDVDDSYTFVVSIVPLQMTTYSADGSSTSKTMENIRKRVKIKLVTKWNGRYGAEAYIAKPEFKNCTIFCENLVTIELGKLQIWWNKPIYVGASYTQLGENHHIQLSLWLYG
ncbi:unnamed protein product [Brassicogethes aeneus]|uniref:Uncharacterized protein n=1 Tax=Brassicogethes aeneus TaxID=1431903 RepID=A0A9P0BFA1_BRAAE|nr:unnamed protein product [Brassicogethes aeneus]